MADYMGRIPRRNGAERKRISKCGLFSIKQFYFTENWHEQEIRLRICVEPVFCMFRIRKETHYAVY